MLRRSLDMDTRTDGASAIRSLPGKGWGAALGRFALLALVALPGAGASTALAGPPPFQKQLDAIVQREIPQQVAVSIQVADVETGRVLMEKDADVPLVPASTLKVVTSAAALNALNPDFTFVTEVLADGNFGSAVGDLYLRGSGDPYLVSEQLFALTRLVKDKGLQEVRGNIVVDDSYFVPGDPVDEQEKLGHRSYHAPYGALSLNFNSVKVLIHPAGEAGKPARVMLDPPSEYASVSGSVKTVKGNGQAQMEITKEPGQEYHEVINVQGTIGVDAPSKGRYVNIASPALYTGDVFKEFLLREGVRVYGKVLRGKTPGEAVPYAEFQSPPLGVVVYWLNKFSNNFMAEQICMAMGAQAFGAPGTRDKGLGVIRKFLESCGVDNGSFSLTEASGLSRSNRISAAALVKVLLASTRSFQFGPEFMSSFGVAGVDGTLREKFTDPSLKRRLRAKTGTLRGVNALAGFGTSPDGKVFVFACIVNSLQKNPGFIQHADNIVKAVLNIPLDRKSDKQPARARGAAQ